MPVPDFSPGEVLTAQAMDSIGLWLVKTQTVGTAVASVTVTGAFSADYDNYRILYTNGTMSATNSINLTLGGSTTNYSNVLIYADYAGGSVLSVGNAATATWTFMGYGSTAAISFDVDLFQPFITKNTFVASRHMQFAGLVGGTTQGILNNATSHTSLTITPATGTLTGGTIRVYGYRN